MHFPLSLDRFLFFAAQFAFMSLRFIVCLLGGCCISAHLSAQPSAILDTTTVASGLDVPWDIEWMGNEQLMVTERGGRISRVNIATQTLTPLLQLDVAEEIHSGLMGLELHPQWPDSNVVFACYSYYDAAFAILMKVERFRYEEINDTLLAESVILDKVTGGSTTTGGRLMAHSDGSIWLSVGDIDNGILAQDSTSLNGKILRVNADGSIPADNLIAGSAVFTFGHRNIQGMVESGSGLVYATEHGPSSTDELNMIENGRNYGWPQVLGTCDSAAILTCQELNVKEPIQTWTPPLAPAGIEAYPGGAFPSWEDSSLLMVSLRDQSLTRLVLSSGGQTVSYTETYLKGELGRLRDIEVSPEGRIFVCTSNQDLNGTPNPGDDRIVELMLQPLSADKALIPGIEIVPRGPEMWTLTLAPGFSGGDVAVMNTEGRTLLHLAIPAGAGAFDFHTGPWPTGIYVVKVSGKQGYWSRKILQK